MSSEVMQTPDVEFWKRESLEMDMMASMRHAILIPLYDAYHHVG